MIDKHVDQAYIGKHIQPNRYFTTPTPLNNWLWFAVAEVDSGYYTSYHSVFDLKPDTAITFFHRNEPLLKSVKDQNELKSLLRFSNGYYTVEQWGDTVVFNDLRFGRSAGWADPNAKFAFHYYLQHPEANGLVVQRGRFANWNSETTRLFIKRIKGN
jgi:inner membrane protein